MRQNVLILREEFTTQTMLPGPTFPHPAFFTLPSCDLEIVKDHPGDHWIQLA